MQAASPPQPEVMTCSRPPAPNLSDRRGEPLFWFFIAPFSLLRLLVAALGLSLSFLLISSASLLLSRSVSVHLPFLGWTLRKVSSFALFFFSLSIYFWICLLIRKLTDYFAKNTLQKDLNFESKTLEAKLFVLMRLYDDGNLPTDVEEEDSSETHAFKRTEKKRINHDAREVVKQRIVRSRATKSACSRDVVFTGQECRCNLNKKNRRERVLCFMSLRSIRSNVRFDFDECFTLIVQDLSAKLKVSFSG